MVNGFKVDTNVLRYTTVNISTNQTANQIPTDTEDDVRHVARTGEMRNAYSIFVGYTEGKSPLGRRKHRWEDNIRMDLREVGWEGVELIHLDQDRDQ
jgi:hypothetical protein